MPLQTPPPPAPQLTLVQFRPGINRELTRYAGEGGWYDCDYVRFRYGKPEKIGGWVNIQGTGQPGTVEGKARSIIDWGALDGTKYVGIGTNLKLYLWQGGEYSDITPVRVSISATDIFNTSAGSTRIVVSVSDHGAISDDFVVFSSVTNSVGGITISGDYQISVISVDAFAIESSSTATGTSTAAGGPTTGWFQINVGLSGNGIGGGWGAGPWGAETWGTPRTSSAVVLPLRTWSLDNWGENLLANPRTGGLYEWVATSGTGAPAALVSLAPSRADFMLVSQEDRHTILFGTEDVVTSAYNPLLIRWCAQENLNDWIASATNDAGDKLLSGASRIAAVLRSRGQILIWTDDPLYAMQNIGPPFTFGFQVIGQNCGTVGPNAVVDIGGRTFWMSDHQFMVYTGAAPQVLPCAVLRYVYDNLDTTQLDKIFAAANSGFNEVIWFYQSLDSTTGDIDRCVAYNYVEDTWWIGSLSRLCWLDKSIYPAPIAFNASGVGYFQETGFNADGQPIISYIESNLFDIDAGQQLMFLDRVIPDQSSRDGGRLEGNLSFYIRYNLYPDGTTYTKGPYFISASTPKVDLRVRGRQMALRVESAGSHQSWRLGSWRMRKAPDGER